MRRPTLATAVLYSLWGLKNLSLCPLFWLLVYFLVGPTGVF